ncbi:MAG: hypothetical protein ACLP0J_21650 [Solirubrobacteraceae bacterium]
MAAPDGGNKGADDEREGAGSDREQTGGDREQASGDRQPADGSDDSADTPDPLRALEQRLERASVAAERLLSEAAWSAAERLAGSIGGAREPAREPDDGEDRQRGTALPPKPPPAGWEPPREREAEHGDRGAAELLSRTAHRLEEMIPADLRRKLVEALRELLLALRALIDWWVERLERRHGAMSALEDIPIL